MIDYFIVYYAGLDRYYYWDFPFMLIPMEVKDESEG